MYSMSHEWMTQHGDKTLTSSTPDFITRNESHDTSFQTILNCLNNSIYCDIANYWHDITPKTTENLKHQIHNYKLDPISYLFQSNRGTMNISEFCFQWDHTKKLKCFTKCLSTKKSHFHLNKNPISINRK